MSNTSIIPVHPNSRIFNAADKAGYGRGCRIVNGKKVVHEMCCLLYSVVAIDDGVATCETWNLMGDKFVDKIPVNHLEPFGPRKVLK